MLNFLVTLNGTLLSYGFRTTMKLKPARYSKRKAQARRTDSPYREIKIFKPQEVDPILSDIKNRKKGDPIRKALCNYLIVRTVSIFEFYMLNSAGRIADNDKVSAKKLFTKIRSDIPVGHQIASSFNFADISVVNDVMTKLLGKDFLKAVYNQSIEYYPDYYLEMEHVTYTRALHNNWEKVLKIFDYRNNIVHQNRLYDFKYSEIRNLIGGTLQFIMCSLMVAG